MSVSGGAEAGPPGSPAAATTGGTIKVPPGPPAENTLGWTTTGPDLDRAVAQEEGDGTATVDVDLGDLLAARHVRGYDTVVLELSYKLQATMWVDGDGTYDPVTDPRHDGLGDDPCPLEPFPLFDVLVNGNFVRTVEGENMTPCEFGSAELVTRTFDVRRVGGDPAIWVRVPVRFLTRGLNHIAFRVRDFSLPAYNPFHDKSADGWRLTVYDVMVELSAPPLAVMHGWELAWCSNVGGGQEATGQAIRNQMKTLLGQDPWRWAGDAYLLDYAYDGKRDFRESARGLLAALDQHYRSLGFEPDPSAPGGRGWLAAHSMGGLVSRWAVEREGGWQRVSRIGQMASPNRGSPLADLYTKCHWHDDADDVVASGTCPLDARIALRFLGAAVGGGYRTREPPPPAAPSYVANFEVRSSLFGLIRTVRFLGWKEWWNTGAFSVGGGCPYADHLADFELLPDGQNPVLQELNAAYPAPGVTYLVVRGDCPRGLSIPCAILRWRIPDGDGIVPTDSQTLGGRIPNCPVANWHQGVPSDPLTHQYLARFFLGLDPCPRAGSAEAATKAAGEGGPRTAGGGPVWERSGLASVDEVVVGDDPDEVHRGHAEQQVLVDHLPTDVVMLQAAQEPPLQVRLRGPDGRIVTPSPTVEYEELSGDDVRLVRYRLAQPDPGTWTVLLDRAPGLLPTSRAAVVVASADGSMVLEAQIQGAGPRQPVQILARLREGDQLRRDVVISARIPLGGQLTELPLADDGAHGDGQAGDGLFGASFTAPAEAGNVPIDLEAHQASGAQPFRRQLASGAAVALPADLELRAIRGSPPGAWGGDPVTLEADLVNLGPGRASAVGVDFYAGDPLDGAPLLGRATVTDLGAGEAATARLATVAPVGALRLVAVVRGGLDPNPANDRASGASPFNPTPRTAAFLNGAERTGGWYAGPVEIRLGPFDGSPSPYQETTYSLDGGPTAPYRGPWTVGAPGLHTLTFRSRDQDGRLEPERSVTFGVDPEAPAVRIVRPAPGTLTVGSTSVPLPTAPALVAGPVDVAIEAADPTSGVARVTVSLDGTPLGEAALGADGLYHFRWDASAVPPGDHTLGAAVADRAGRQASAALGVTVL